MAARNHASTRYSEMAEITPENTSQFQVAWTSSTGILCGPEAAPFVVGDTMHVVTTYPNTNDDLVACRDRVNRGWYHWSPPDLHDYDGMNENGRKWVMANMAAFATTRCTTLMPG